MTQNIVEIDLDEIKGLDPEEIDSSVNYYAPFCLVGIDNTAKKEIQMFFTFERLLEIAALMKPYVDSHEAELKMEEEMEEEMEKEMDVDDDYMHPTGKDCEDCPENDTCLNKEVN